MHYGNLIIIMLRIYMRGLIYTEPSNELLKRIKWLNQPRWLQFLFYFTYDVIQFCYKSNYVTNGFLIMLRIFSARPMTLSEFRIEML